MSFVSELLCGFLFRVAVQGQDVPNLENPSPVLYSGHLAVSLVNLVKGQEGRFKTI